MEFVFFCKNRITQMVYIGKTGFFFFLVIKKQCLCFIIVQGLRKIGKRRIVIRSTIDLNFAIGENHSTRMANQMNTYTSQTGDKIASKTVHINAPASKVWAALTTPDVMQKWMMPDSAITIRTDWQVGSPFLIHGNLHGIKFENKGLVLQFEREKVLEYSHLSSASRLADQPESYSVITFGLVQAENGTDLTISLRNFPTETIYKHLVFYWNSTVEVLKQMIESESI